MSLSKLFVTTFYNYSNKTDDGQDNLVASVLVFLVLVFLIHTPTFPINPVGFCSIRGCCYFMIITKIYQRHCRIGVKGRLQNNLHINNLSDTENRFSCQLFKDFFDDQFSFRMQHMF